MKTRGSFRGSGSLTVMRRILCRETPLRQLGAERVRPGLTVRHEDLLDERVEQAGDLEGEGEARVVATGLDRVDRLARDGESLREGRLRPLALGAENVESVSHRKLDFVTFGSLRALLLRRSLRICQRM